MTDYLILFGYAVATAVILLGLYLFDRWRRFW